MALVILNYDNILISSFRNPYDIRIFKFTSFQTIENLVHTNTWIGASENKKNVWTAVNVKLGPDKSQVRIRGFRRKQPLKLSN